MQNKTGFRLSVKVANLPEDTFAVADLVLDDEALKQPFTLELHLASAQYSVNSASLPDNTCILRVWHDGKLQREIYGIIMEADCTDNGLMCTVYRLRIRPLPLLTRVYKKSSVIKKLKTISYMILLIMFFCWGHYSIPFIQLAETEVIYVSGGLIVVKNFPRSRKYRAEWWLKHQDWLKKEHGVDLMLNSILFTDIGTGFKVDRSSPDAKFLPYDRWADNDSYCFEEIKLIANCLDKENFFMIEAGRVRNGKVTDKTIVYNDENGYFLYSKETGVIDVKWDF